jgi:hypothetical protein
MQTFFSASGKVQMLSHGECITYHLPMGISESQYARPAALATFKTCSSEVTLHMLDGGAFKYEKGG